MKKIILTLSVIVFAIIVVAPLFSLLSNAIFSKEGAVDTFLKVCCSKRALLLLARSIFIALGTTIFALALGSPVGFLIARTNVHFKEFARYLCFLPLLIPSYISAISWITLLRNLKIMGFFYGPFGVIFTEGLSYFPFVVILTISGLVSTDRRLEDQARLSASEKKVFLSVTLPLIAPFIIAGSLFVFVFSLSNYGVPALLGVNTYPMEIFTQFSAFYNHNAAVIASLPILLITFFILIISYRIMKDKSYVSLEGQRQKPQIICLGKKRLPCSLWVWSIIFISGLAPLFMLMVSAGSLSVYARVLKTSLEPIITSLLLSFAGATLCVILGVFLSFIIERIKLRGIRLLDALTILPLAVPPTVLGIGLIKLWNNPRTEYIYAGFLIVVFGFTARFLPFAVRILTSNFKQINRNMEEAADLCGTGFLKTALEIFFPLMRPCIAFSWIICFVFCMGELGTTLMVMPAGFETLSGKIFTLMHYGVGRLTSALCVVLIFVTIMPVVFVGLLGMRGYACDTN